MPWKNGLGTTAEIARGPEAAGGNLDAFTWRLSIAEIGASGPFSTFPGYDRILVQIEGAPMTLSHAEGGAHRLRLLEPYAFAGELSTYGALETPPARDFNVIVRRDQAGAEVAAHTLAAGEAVRGAGGVALRIAHLLRGEASIAAGGETSPLGAGETLVAAGAEGSSLVITAAAEGAALLLVVITSCGARPG